MTNVLSVRSEPDRGPPTRSICLAFVAPKREAVKIIDKLTLLAQRTREKWGTRQYFGERVPPKSRFLTGVSARFGMTSVSTVRMSRHQLSHLE